MMEIIIPDEIVHAARLTEGEMLWDITVKFLQQRRITLEQACQMLRMKQNELLEKLTAELVRTDFNRDAVQQIIDTMRKQGW